MTLSLNYIFIYIDTKKVWCPMKKQVDTRQCGKSYPEVITEPYERI